MEVLHTSSATARGGRDGHVRSDDGQIDLDMVRPGGGNRRGSNPEQLFAAGYAACFESAIRAVAKRDNRPLTDTAVTAKVSLNRTDDGKNILGVELQAEVPGLAKAEVAALMKSAHELCPYSAATRNNVQVTLTACETPTRSVSTASAHARPHAGDRVEEAGMESFPASDPPAY